jgi:hypothetical protein
MVAKKSQTQKSSLVGPEIYCCIYCASSRTAVLCSPSLTPEKIPLWFVYCRECNASGPTSLDRDGAIFDWSRPAMIEEKR